MLNEREKGLPKNLEAERAVLGSILINDEALSDVVDILLPEDFWAPEHRDIYRAMLTCTVSREPADYVHVCSRLSNAEGKAGDPGYITSLINEVPTSSRAAFYARMVRQVALRRHLIGSAGQIAAIAYESEDAQDALAQAEALILGITHGRAGVQDFLSLGDYWHTYLGELDKRTTLTSGRGVPTGIADLDTLALLQKGNLAVIAGRPGVGKTTFAQNVTLSTAEKGYRVGFFSCEMPLDALVDSFVSRVSGIPSQNLLKVQLTEDEHAWLVGSENHLPEFAIFLKHAPGIYLDDLAHQARRLMARQHVDLLVIDYLQLVRARLNGKRVTPREMEIAEVARGLKTLAGELNVPLLVPAQLSREIETRLPERDDITGLTYRMPQLSFLRESGEIEQSSDSVSFLVPSEEKDEQVKLVIGKNRRGPKGELNLYFDGEKKRFSSLYDYLKGV